MRVRTEARRRAILEAARSVFDETGFERATMSAISERLGGSKATLYGYFASKEELFMAVIEDEIESEASQHEAVLRSTADLREALEYLGRVVIANMTSIRPLSIYRMLASQPADSRVGRDFLENTIKPVWLSVASFLQERMEAGELRATDPWTAAMLLKGLYEGRWIDMRMLNAMPDDLDDAAIAEHSRVAADTFLRAFGARPDAAAA